MTTAELKMMIMAQVSNTCIEDVDQLKKLSEYWYDWVMKDVTIKDDSTDKVVKLQPVN